MLRFVSCKDINAMSRFTTRQSCVASLKLWQHLANPQQQKPWRTWLLNLGPNLTALSCGNEIYLYMFGMKVQAIYQRRLGDSWKVRQLAMKVDYHTKPSLVHLLFKGRLQYKSVFPATEFVYVLPSKFLSLKPRNIYVNINIFFL